MVPYRNHFAARCNCDIHRFRRHEEKNNSTLDQFSEVRWVEKKHTARYRQEFMQSITALSPAYSNDNHVRAIQNDPLAVCSSQAALGLNRTLQCQCAAWTRRFPSRSRKPAATASWKQIWKWNSWKWRRSKFEVMRHMQKKPQTPHIHNALVISWESSRREFPRPVRASWSSKGHTWVDGCCSLRGIMTRPLSGGMTCFRRQTQKRFSVALSMLRMSLSCALFFFAIQRYVQWYTKS